MRTGGWERRHGQSHRLVSGTGALEGRPRADHQCGLELRPRRAPAGSRGVRRDAGRDPAAGGPWPRARDPRARPLRDHPESEDAAVRRIRALGSDAERVSGKPARSDGPRVEVRRVDGCRHQTGRQPSGTARLRSLLLLAARDDARNAPAGVLVGEPDGADVAPARAEDGAAVARPLRDPREQGPRLPQDDAADRIVRAGRDGQPARSDHPGRPEPRDAVLPRRAVQRQGGAERELRPRGDGALHHGRRQLLGEGRARMRARVHGVVLRQPRVQGRPGEARRRREDVPRPDRELRRRGRPEDHLRAAGDRGVSGREDLSLPGARRAVTGAAQEAGRGPARRTTTKSSRC